MDVKEVKEVKLDTVNVDNSDNNNTKRIIRSNLADGASFEDFLTEQLGFQTYKLGATQRVSLENVHILESVGTSASKKEDETKSTEANQQNQNNNQANSTSSTSNSSVIDRSTDHTIRLEAKDLSVKDLEQLQQLIQNPNIAININQINGLNSSNIFYNNSGINSKTLTFSKNLSEAIQNAYKSNRPVRISIEKDTSVILSFDREGKVSAKFITSDKAMEMLLKENLYLLKIKLEKEGLPHNELSYSDHQQNKKDRNNQQEEDS